MGLMTVTRVDANVSTMAVYFVSATLQDISHGSE